METATQKIDTRVEREKTAYEQGLRRRSYNRIFNHTHHLYRQKRSALAGEILRSVPHASVLEIGCDVWVHFLERNGIEPDTLICTNIAQRELDQGIEAARHTKLQPTFQIMDAHHLEFPDHRFDVVCGIAILHHLDLEIALQEARRVLKPGGLLLFAEPLDNNPVGRLVRRLTPRARTVDERPFRMGQLALLSKYFDCDFHFEQFLSVPLGITASLLFSDPDNVLTRFAFRADEQLAQTFPRLGPYYRHALIAGRPRREAGQG